MKILPPVTFKLIGVVSVNTIIEERMLGESGHEEIDKSLEDIIWSFEFPVIEGEKYGVKHKSKCSNNSNINW